MQLDLQIQKKANLTDCSITSTFLFIYSLFKMVQHKGAQC